MVLVELRLLCEGAHILEAHLTGVFGFGIDPLIVEELAQSMEYRQTIITRIVNFFLHRIGSGLLLWLGRALSAHGLVRILILGTFQPL